MRSHPTIELYPTWPPLTKGREPKKPRCCCSSCILSTNG